MPDELPDVRITDIYVKEIITKVQRMRHGDGGTPTKTAGQMILERYAQIERDREQSRPRRRERQPA